MRHNEEKSPVAGRLKTEQKKCLVYAKENGLNPQPFVR
jgi:hypothetical protein